MLEALVQWLLDAGTFIVVSLIKNIATIFWMVQRTIGAIANLITTSDFWSGGVDQLLTQTAKGLPEAYENILLGSSGLLYIGLILVGTFMLIPQFINRRRAVELDRLLYWSMFVTTLFISSTAGFDFIKGLELARLNLSQSIRTQMIPSGSMAGLVGGMVEAMDAEITERFIFAWELPAVYQTRYFEHESDTVEIEVEYYDVDLLGVLQTRKVDVLTVDTPESRLERLTKASAGLLLMVLNIVPTLLTFVVVWLFVLLAVQSLMCILYFLFVVPVGMFEFGTNLLAEIAQRYMLIWILSIMTSVLPTLLIAVNKGIFTNDLTSGTQLVSGTVIYLFTTGVITLVLLQLGKTVQKLVGDTYQTLGKAINTAIMPYAHDASLAAYPTPVQDGIRRIRQTNADVSSLLVGGASLYATGDPRVGMAAANVIQQRMAPRDDAGRPNQSAAMHVFNEGALVMGASSQARKTRTDRSLQDWRGASQRMEARQAGQQARSSGLWWYSQVRNGSVGEEGVEEGEEK